MALPKRRHSSTRRDKSRTHQKLALGQTSVCVHCGRTRRPHHACPFCGFYKGRVAVTIKTKEKAAK